MNGAYTEVKSFKWPSPAKLNLFLHIVGRRPDGYHLLQSIFRFTNLCDFINYEILESEIIKRSSDNSGIREQDDLVIRAANLLKEKSNSKLGVNISILKNIPIGGGLGGGSSNAATTLVALNHLWKIGLSTDELAEIGLSLGADIPFFIRGNTAWVEGIGEELTSIELDGCFYLIVYSGHSVSTRAVFEADDLTRNTPRITIRDFFDGNSKNDCEEYVRNYYGDVGEALDWLSKYVDAHLTGTGGCLFAKFKSEKMANDVKDKLPPKWKGYVVTGINKSPLLRKLEDEQRH